jgi:hypothetical protein
MKKIAFIFILAASCVGSSLAFGIQSGPMSPTTNTNAAIETNGPKTEKQNMNDTGRTKKAKKQVKRDAKQTEASRPLTAEEQEWEKAVYTP